MSLRKALEIRNMKLADKSHGMKLQDMKMQEMTTILCVVFSLSHCRFQQRKEQYYCNAQHRFNKTQINFVSFDSDYLRTTAKIPNIV